MLPQLILAFQSLVWSQPGPAAATVSLPGDVYTASSLAQSNTRSLSVADGSVTWQAQAPGMTWTCRVSGAASIFDAGAGVYVRTPSWLWQFPTPASTSDRLWISSSRDGQRIAAAFDSTLVVFDNGTPTTLALGFSALGLDLSADGSTLLVTGDMATRVFAVPSLAVLYSSAPSSYTFHGQGISGNGDVFAIGRMGRVDVFRRTGGVYGFDFQHTPAGTNYCDRLDVSDDGSTLVAGFNHFDTNAQVTVDVVDLATHAALNHYTQTSTTTNFVGDVNLSATGEIVALGLWGDGPGPLPELLFLRRGVTSPITTYSIDGQVLDLDLAADGALCAVGTKSSGTGDAGFVSLYRVLRRSLGFTR